MGNSDPSGTQRKDLIAAPLCEAALLCATALAGWLVHHPLIFASLGPTAYELIETPERPSAQPYNVIVGHLIAVLSGFLALYLTGAWFVPVVSTANVALARVWAAAVAALLTVLFTLLLRASQPAACATTLLVALGLMQSFRDGITIMVGVILLDIIGEPLRRWRVKQRAALAS